MSFAKRLLILVVSAVCFPVSAPGNILDSPWPMLQHDMYHTGHSLLYGPVIKDADIQFDTFVAAGVSSPVIDTDGNVFLGSTDGCVYAVSPDGETSDCIYRAGGPIESTPVLADDGTLYVGSNDGRLHALTPEGRELWSLELGDKLTSSPAIGPSGRLFIGSGNEDGSGALFCISDKGEILWHYSTGMVNYSSPAVDSFGNVYICSFDGTLYAIGSDGTLLWTYTADNAIVASPAIGIDGTIYLASLSALTALDAAGNTQWTFVPTAEIFGTPENSGFAASPVLGSDGNIYIGGILGDLHCLNGSGSEQWTVMIKKMTINDPYPAPVLSPLALDMANSLYLRSQNTLYAFTSDSSPLSEGFPLSSLPAEQTSMIEAALALGANRTLYIASSDGNLYGFGPDRQALAIAGSVASEVPEGITVFIKGREDERSATADATGRYRFSGLYSGTYLVTPRMQGMTFDPPSRQVELLYQDELGIDFTAEIAGLQIVSALATPETAPNDALAPILLTAEVIHLQGSENIASVTVNLAEIGGDPGQELFDDGNHGDETPGDGTYSFTTVISPDVPLGPTGLEVRASDLQNKTSRRLIGLNVTSKITGTDTGEYRVAVAGGGQLLTIRYSLSSIITASARALAAADADADTGFFLQIFAPDNTLYFEDSITAEEKKLKIENAAAGTWLYKIASRQPSSKTAKAAAAGLRPYAGSGAQYSISSTTSGTGIVTGEVTDAETGAPLNNVRVATNTGALSETQDGYYFLLSPAGTFTITASDADHTPSSRTVNLMSGSSVEANILLAPKGIVDDGQDDCPIASSFEPGSETVDLARLFRDTVLSKTPAGRSYIQAYYRFAPEVMTIIRENPSLQSDIRGIVAGLVPGIKTLLDKSDIINDTHIFKDIKNSLEYIKSRASAPLKQEIDTVLENLANRPVRKLLRDR